MHLKNFLYYQRGERLAIIILLILIFVSLIINASLTARKPSTIVINKNDSIIAAFETFYNNLEIDSSMFAYTNSHTTNRSYKRPAARAIDITPNNSNIEYKEYPKSEKLGVGETISINSNDTTDWKKVPGIGSSFASRIIKYRDLLGGYVCVEQLTEVYGMDEDRYSNILPYIQVDGDITMLNINKLEFKELLKHPYLNYEQVQSITNLRKKKGDIGSIKELSMLDDFTQNDIERLEKYLEF